MGTSLSGLTPATTFDGLLKTGDNEPIGASLKALSDGSGNDMPIEASTTTINFTNGLTKGGVDVATINDVTPPAGSEGQIQFNESSAFGADSNLYWDNTNKRLGVGETTPTARVQIKGSGNTSSTTSLLVENSDGNDILKVTDDKRVLIDEYIYPADGTTNSSFRVSNSSGTYMYYSTGNLRLNPSLVYTSTTYGTVFSVSNSTGDFSLNGATGAKMAIKGNGATSATNALLVQNSAGTELLKITDGGLSTIKSAVFTTSAQFRGFVDANNNSNLNFIVPSSGNSFVISKTYNPSNDASALLDVQSTTQGFLPPRMTTTEKNAISSPASGLMVYDTTTNKLCCYNGTTWNDLF